MFAGPHRAARFGREEDGSVTVLGIFIFLAVIIIAGLALDVSNAYRVRTQLQIAGDSAAHAALVAREFNDSATAISLALDIADANLPGATSGSALRAEDIVFGHWDAANQTFKPDPNASGAVLVNTGRSQDRQNSLSTYLLRFAGVNAFDVRRQTVFETYRPSCFSEGIVGDTAVEAAIGSVGGGSLCIHSNGPVTVKSQSVIADDMDDLAMVAPDTTYTGETDDELDDGATISTTTQTKSNVRSLLPPSDSGYETFMIRILPRVDDIIAGVRDPASAYYRDYIDSNVTIALSKDANLDATAFTSGRIHTLTCSSSEESATIPANTTLSNLVLWTNCRLFFGENVALENAVIVNESTSTTSFYGPNGIRLGRDDQCAQDGGAQLVTKGGVEFHQQLKMFGGQIIAAGDIGFVADTDGLEGISIVSGGMIAGSTGSAMTVCAGQGMEDNFEADYFRLAY